MIQDHKMREPQPCQTTCHIRKEFLRAYAFQSLTDVCENSREFINYYNENRPHRALAYLTPKEVCDMNISY
jgi:transposase InsO family protein